MFVSGFSIFCAPHDAEDVPAIRQLALVHTVPHPKLAHTMHRSQVPVGSSTCAELSSVCKHQPTSPATHTVKVLYNFPARSSASRRLFFHYGVHPGVLFLRAKRQVLLFSKEGFVYPPDLPRVVVAEGVGERIRSGLRSTAARLLGNSNPLSAFLGSHPPIAAVGGLGRVGVTAGTALMLDGQRQATS